MTAGPSGTVRRRRFLAALLAGYLLVLSLIAFWPSPVDEGASGFIARFLGFLHRNGVPGWFDYNLIESGANVLLFIPFGVLVAAYLPLRHAWLALPAGVVASLCIELGQEQFRPERFATPRDVLANALGAAVGTVAVYAWAHRHSEEDTERR
ncbi:VanZ like family protein [Arthrobacter subterraneus]|uniref:VanZ like family protein n=1 Tax=Arthrobacter subterraneus TaxID=335973 RepID=A0A1G8J4P8_9MICC|nr:VanZ family protein [Arthrobacter subterraneus]SDI26032.1 VanZ like family protein [Arthrobacter subterraneus]